MPRRLLPVCIVLGCAPTTAVLIETDSDVPVDVPTPAEAGQRVLEVADVAPDGEGGLWLLPSTGRTLHHRSAAGMWDRELTLRLGEPGLSLVSLDLRDGQVWQSPARAFSQGHLVVSPGPAPAFAGEPPLQGGVFAVDADGVERLWERTDGLLGGASVDPDGDGLWVAAPLRGGGRGSSAVNVSARGPDVARPLFSGEQGNRPTGDFLALAGPVAEGDVQDVWTRAAGGSEPAYPVTLQLSACRLTAD